MPKYNFDNRNCDYCHQFHYKGELIYIGKIPNRGNCFICVSCKASADEKRRLKKLRESQPTLFD